MYPHSTQVGALIVAHVLIAQRTKSQLIFVVVIYLLIGREWIFLPSHISGIVLDGLVHYCFSKLHSIPFTPKGNFSNFYSPITSIWETGNGEPRSQTLDNSPVITLFTARGAWAWSPAPRWGLCLPFLAHISWLHLLMHSSERKKQSNQNGHIM